MGTHVNRAFVAVVTVEVAVDVTVDVTVVDTVVVAVLVSVLVIVDVAVVVAVVVIVVVADVNLHPLNIPFVYASTAAFKMSTVCKQSVTCTKSTAKVHLN